jgi:hypothetical protein
MKKIIAPIAFSLSLLVPVCARADTALTINGGSPFGCLQNAYINPTPPQVNSTFTLPGVSGSGTVHSAVPGDAPTFGYPPLAYIFNYTLDISSMGAAANHCVKLLIHFGSPQGCGYNEVWGSPSAIQSATLAPFGDITFTFNTGCLTPGQPSVGFTMFSEAAYKTGSVTVIDNYVDPVTGSNLVVRVTVPALVPDIPPNPPFWLLASSTFPRVIFQGLINTNIVGTNQTGGTLPPSGSFDFTLQMLNGPSNSLAVSPVYTQSVQVVKGVFNLPLPFEANAMCDGSARWLSIGARPSGVPAVQFTPVGPPMPITPTPQAYYAYSAGVVADLTPGQAVTSLNGLTDAINLQAGQGIIIGTNGNTLTISAAVGSDRNIKTDINAIKPDDILARVAQLPILSWRYNNEAAGIRHVGPMAQDFKAAFGLGDSDKYIGFVDEGGVALAAIQGLHQKLQDQSAQLDAREAEIQKLKEKNAALEHRLDSLEQTMKATAPTR